MAIVIDEHEFKEVEDGLLQAVTPFDVDIDSWTYNRSHAGYQAITDGYNENTARILFISINGDGAMRLIKMYNRLRKDGQDVGYIESIPDENAMGEVYA